MSTAYNHFNDAYKAKQADRTVLVDPADRSDTVVYLHETDDAIVTLGTAGTYTLQPATDVAVNTNVLVLAQASVTAEGVALTDGQWAEFKCVVNSAGANVWAQSAGTAITAGVAGLAVLAPVSAAVATPVALGTVSVVITDAPTDALVVALANILIDAGLATGTVT